MNTIRSSTNISCPQLLYIYNDEVLLNKIY